MSCNCPSGARIVQVQIQGAQGGRGDQGERGERGETGLTPSIQVAAVSLAPEETATAVRSGGDETPLFTFGIPRGRDGKDGKDGTSSVETIESAFIDNLF